MKAHGTYRQRILVVFNLRFRWEWLVSEVSQAARQELCGSITVEQEMCHTSTVRPMLTVHLTICHSPELEKEFAKMETGQLQPNLWHHLGTEQRKVTDSLGLVN